MPNLYSNRGYWDSGSTDYQCHRKIVAVEEINGPVLALLLLVRDRMKVFLGIAPRRINIGKTLLEGRTILGRYVLGGITKICATVYRTAALSNYAKSLILSIDVVDFFEIDQFKILKNRLVLVQYFFIITVQSYVYFEFVYKYYKDSIRCVLVILRLN